METTGYSGTSLAKKLGYKNGFTIRIVNQPPHYLNLFTDFPSDISHVDEPDVKKDLIHYFTTDYNELERDILLLKKEIKQNGMIWVSWPKKSSKAPTNVTEDIVRNLALANGLVDVKVCAVDATWSGLKLVIPVKDRN